MSLGLSVGGITLHKIAPNHLVTSMLATSKNVLYLVITTC